MEIKRREQDGFFIYDIYGDVNELDNYNIFKKTINDSVANNELHIIMNLKNTTFINSNTISLFIVWVKSATENGGRLIIVEPNERITEILMMVGLDQVIPIHFSESKFLEQNK